MVEVQYIRTQILVLGDICLDCWQPNQLDKEPENRRLKIEDKEIVKRVREDIADIVLDYKHASYSVTKRYMAVDKILSHPNIKITRDDGTVIKDGKEDKND